MTATVPDSVETTNLPLDAGRRRALVDAASRIDQDWMADLLVRLVEIPSPFGEEAAIAEALVEIMHRGGLTAVLQRLDTSSANAIGTLQGTGEGPELMIFAPLDSPFTGSRRGRDPLGRRRSARAHARPGGARAGHRYRPQRRQPEGAHRRGDRRGARGGRIRDRVDGHGPAVLRRRRRAGRSAPRRDCRAPNRPRQGLPSTCWLNPVSARISPPISLSSPSRASPSLGKKSG